MPRSPGLLITLLALVLSVGVTGCGGEDGGGGGAESQTGGGQGPTTVESGTLTVGSDIPFPPFEFRENGQLTGFDVRLTEAMAERLGLEVRWVDTSFDTIFTSLAAGQFDMVASATSITEERERQVNFTEPYYAAQQALTINARETPGVQSVEDLESGSVVAVQRGTTGERWARENVPEGVSVRSFPEAPDTYTALEAGNVAAVLFDEPSAITEVEQRDNLEIVQTIDTGERYGFPVNPRNEELLTALDGALAEIKEDGTYQEIYEEFDELPAGGNVVEVDQSASEAPAP
jgi:polar amino acid transport system substrate-binding protein